METKYYLNEPCLMENYNAYEKYGLVGVCGYLQDEYGKLFKNVRWHVLSGITYPERNTALAQGTDDNVDPPCDDGRKCYKCGGNNLLPDFP